jgi:hypothetical protein
MNAKNIAIDCQAGGTRAAFTWVLQTEDLGDPIEVGQRGRRACSQECDCPPRGDPLTPAGLAH